MEYIAIYLLFINVIAVACCFVDKSRAKRGKWRIPEKTLFIISALGGSVGMYATMRFIRHKTKHKRFMIGLPLIIMLQTIFLLIFLYLVA
ncbi:MAG: DUF1294 domain-containing protein [Clostridia bacterium]|nr:DUF1294 domain-containing protein [Clostridia bacterium]